jgi:8-oxo-dGTP pyrophosphatase MutT (NUDIX family)
MMSLEELHRKLDLRLKQPLPGAEAHDVLRAIPVGATIPRFEHKLPPRPGSVLILLYDNDGTICFPLIKRPVYLGAHSGQVSLPGGKAEEGENTVETALREAEEEVGVNRNDVEVVGLLSQFFVIPSNYLVTPVVAIARHTPAFNPDPKEVDRILYGSIDQLIDVSAIRKKEILAAGQFRMMAPHFEIENEVVWGATAMMLNEFRMVLLDM